MPHAIYLIIFNSPLFPAHWAMYIPHATTTGKGTLINVRGDPSTGFCHEFERNYDPNSTADRKKLLYLCDVEEEHIVDMIGDGAASIDAHAVDDIERMALQAVRTNVAIQNCQTWMVQLVEALVDAKIMPALALEVAKSAPKN